MKILRKKYLISLSLLLLLVYWISSSQEASLGLEEAEEIEEEAEEPQEHFDKELVRQSLRGDNINPFDFKVQREAIQAWGKSLTDNDLSPSAWPQQPQYMFEMYIHKLSDIFKEAKAKTNFILVGACDGTHDRTISEGYLKNDHWRGAFVEPFEINYRDLVKFMDSVHVLDRTHLIHAAATYQCNSSTIKMKRPTFEEKNTSLPHWMRREIGAIVPFDKLSRPATGGWIFEYVRCVNGPDILEDWATALNKMNKRGKENAGKAPIRVRPHILKVDVEGHDYEVLAGFISDSVPSTELPLLISFEAKSITKKFHLLKSQMEKRGYVLSDGDKNDGFAMLKPSIFLKQRKSAEKHGEVRIEHPEKHGKEGRKSGKGSGKRKRKGKKSLRKDD